MTIPLDEWIETMGWKDFEKDVKIHLKGATNIDPADIDQVTRCIMISLRQKIKENAT